MRNVLFSLLMVALSPLAPAGSAAPAAAGKVAIYNRHPDDQTIAYAATELRKYINLMAGREDAAVLVRKGDDTSGAIELGLFGDFGIPTTGLKNPALDDAIRVRVSGAKGRIAGSNPRSVLFGVYRLLEANGCRWLRPGRGGETVPSKDAATIAADISDKPAYRFRGNNNCGTFPIEDILDKIEWLPKVGLNTFFNEFSLPMFIFNEWYEHTSNDLMLPEARSAEEVRALHERSIREIKRRGLLYHAYGHGWTGAALGLTEAEVNDRNFRITGEKEKYVAMVNGTRKSDRYPILTDLCYGNPEVQRMMVAAVADYAEEHRDVDYLHIWLGDVMNRHCECDLCKNTRPSDFYVEMLNGVDRELARRGLETRIVFLIYVDLLWPPEKQRFQNPDRFVMMFAPIGRSYAEPYELSEDASIPPYVRNKNANPTTSKETVAFVRAWQKVFPGAAFVFDYHFVWYHYMDPGYFKLSDLVAEDIQRLPKLKMDGFVSCQNVRAFFPTGYPLYVHARALWNPDCNLRDLAREYFQSSFGADGLLCMDYMKSLSEAVDAPAFYRWKRGRTDPAIAAKLAGVPKIINDFRPVVERNLKLADKSLALSWRYVFLHMEMAELLTHTMRALAQGDQALANRYGAQLTEYLQINEPRIRPVFDLWRFSGTMRRLYQPVPDAFKVKGR